MIFGIKTRGELKEEIFYLKDRLKISDALIKSDEYKIEWYESVVNKIIFRNETTEKLENSVTLCITKLSEEDLPDNNATFYCGEDGPYLYLSKKLTEGYTHLSINFRNRRVRFYLNNDGIGLEIDSNNRVKDKDTLQFLKEYFGVKSNKCEIIFEKI